MKLLGDYVVIKLSFSFNLPVGILRHVVARRPRQEDPTMSAQPVCLYSPQHQMAKIGNLTVHNFFPI